MHGFSRKVAMFQRLIGIDFSFKSVLSSEIVHKMDVNNTIFPVSLGTALFDRAGVGSASE